jgi:hypothetical protein
VPPFSWPAAPAKRKPPFGEAGGLSLLSTGLIRGRVRRIRRQRQSSTCDDRHREKLPAVTTSGFESGIRGSVWECPEIGGDRDGIDITDLPLAGVGTMNAAAFAEDWPLRCGFQPSPVIAEAV